ncbi:uncharacterized protein PFLUO_LOCUS323 [Penicillium psychrofluorescens]|uniref:uncharacterized protein n=1 Tax=Penicillium psychrofluorescens TaxID=3158075 RepID=UPI003CCD2E69
MTASVVETARVNPRRRPVLNTDAAPSSEGLSGPSKMRLQKGETFHSPTTPPADDRDPVMSVRSLPRRSPTSLEAIAANEQRMTSLLGRLSLGTDSEESNSKDPINNIGTAVKSEPPVDEANELSGSDEEKMTRQSHSHESDSGLGTSVSSVESVSSDESNVKEKVNAITCTAAATFDKRQLGLNACKQIEKFVLVPILKESRLKPFHPLVQSVPQRIVNKQIVCLRDLEKTLLWLAPKSAPTRLSYLNFCEFTIQCLHTSASHLNARDQRLPADRPYTNGYFLDLVSQVRRYAAMIRESRERIEAAQAAKSADDKNEKATEPTITGTLKLENGLSKTGKPAELVLVQEDGKPISMRTGEPYEADLTSPVFKRMMSFDESVDEGVQRSMARRKKNAPPMDINQKCSHCDKIFKRPCDLTKHEKTHSRPWKCTQSSCKYFQVGWPTEKERDRHINDKHSNTPALYTCSFKPCTYASKRESNCKQHMEKAHGWVYVRSKNNARGHHVKRGSSSMQATPQTPSVSTPGSKPTDFSTPTSGPSPSPLESNMGFADNSNFNFNDPPAPPRSDDFPLFLENSPYHTSSAGLSNDLDPSFGSSMNLDAFQAQFGAGDPNGLISSLEMHRQSMNTMSVPSADSVPELMGPVSFDGSPLASTENASLNFDLEWSQLDMQNLGEDYTAMQMQLPPAGNSMDAVAMKAYTRDIPLMGDAADFSYKLSGLSPHAQGNPMLYSPHSGQVEERLSDRYDYSAQHRVGNDFTLYEQNVQMNQAATTHPMMPATTTHQPAGQYNQNHGMFPPLDREQALHGIQTWADQQQQHGAAQGSRMPSDMDLDFMG